MSMRGGYQIINLDNVPFKSDDMNTFTYREMYYNLLNSNSKLIILSGLNMDGVKYADNDVVFYEVEGESDYPIFQAVLRLTWNQAEHTCTTRYINIQSAEEEPYSWKDAKVWLSASTIIYEDVDQALDIDSEKAIANKVVTENINRLDEEDMTFLKLDGSREMTGSLVLPQVSSGERSITQSGSVFRVNNKSGNPVIFDGVATPASNEHGANKKYVDDNIKAISPPKYSQESISTKEESLNLVDFYSDGISFHMRISVASGFNSCTFSINSQDIIDYYNTIHGVNETEFSMRYMMFAGLINEDSSDSTAMNVEVQVNFSKNSSNGIDITIKDYGNGTINSIRNYYLTGFLYK